MISITVDLAQHQFSVDGDLDDLWLSFHEYLKDSRLPHGIPITREQVVEALSDVFDEEIQDGEELEIIFI